MTPEYKTRDRARKGRSERERKCVESLFAMMVAQLPGTRLRGHILLLLLSLVLVIDGARTGKHYKLLVMGSWYFLAGLHFHRLALAGLLAPQYHCMGFIDVLMKKQTVQ